MASELCTVRGSPGPEMAGLAELLNQLADACRGRRQHRGQPGFGHVLEHPRLVALGIEARQDQQRAGQALFRGIDDAVDLVLLQAGRAPHHVDRELPGKHRISPQQVLHRGLGDANDGALQQRRRRGVVYFLAERPRAEEDSRSVHGDDGLFAVWRARANRHGA